MLDTNVWLDWLVFDDPGVAALRALLERRAVEIVIDAACEEELERVLAYRFRGRVLSAQEQAARLAECRRLARKVELAAATVALPACRDADDQKFLALALAARADALVTKDAALLELARRKLPFRIVKPGDKTLLGGNSG